MGLQLTFFWWSDLALANHSRFSQNTSTTASRRGLLLIGAFAAVRLLF